MIRMEWPTGRLEPALETRQSVNPLAQLEEIFADADALRRMDSETVVYRVQAWCPVPEGTEGGLYWGNTVVEPGRVGSEYFMTHGHFHRKRDRTEYYATVQGQGALILMDEDGRTSMEPMSAGSVHFIPPHVAHRVANVGQVPLHVVACWPSDAGHDYESIRQKGFGARLVWADGQAVLVRSDA